LRHTPSLVMPVLSAGKHRHPRQGACFMEFASYLAGERWSDHPACTHSLLASVARQVNDSLSDSARAGIVELIPRVVGLNGSDPRIDIAIAVRAAATALPIAAEPRQNVLAAGLLACRAWIQDASRSHAEVADEDARFVESLLDDVEDALARTPQAHRWANEFVETVGTALRRIPSEAAPNMVRVAVEGVASACVPDSDPILVRMLRDAIDSSERLTGEVRTEGVCNVSGVLQR
jgi:hypothetical protein